MKRNPFISIIKLTVLPAALLACACADEYTAPAETTDTRQHLSIFMAPPKGDAVVAETRAVRMDSADQWSYVGFTAGDKMGFYASGGNWMNGTYATPFDNFELTYQEGNGQFNGPNDATFEPSGMKPDEVFMYFPYSETMDDPGMPLRVSYDNDLRCIDLLTSDYLTLQGTQNNVTMSLYGEFNHAFAELIIMRGEGFNEPPQDKTRITAVLSQGYTHFKITYDPEEGWNCTPSLVYDASGGLTSEQARKWNAWQGSNYGITTADEVGTPAWYVIVPTLTDVPTTVEYIELCDNDGYYQRVSSLKLRNGNTKFVDPGWRYPMEITMKELVPTVNPYRIIPWGENVDLTDQRTRGINDETEFALWVRDYNLYLANPDNEDLATLLLQYGDRITETGSTTSNWHFYVLSDLDLTNYTPLDPDVDDMEPLPQTDYDVIVTRLAAGDILDGVSTVLQNDEFQSHTISGLTTTFIGTLSGTIQNFEFIMPEVSNDDDTPVGIIATTINNGYVIDCDIERGMLYNPDGPAGMVAGQMNGGYVTDCNLSGTLISASTSSIEGAEKIIGENPTGEYFFVNNDVSMVVTP